ncbi:hypothetical protein D9758_011853 [Tetrapyrgos nigripes]|uniref:Terpene synthase n=1 Tax=Tetrapyrgos nigripes TaxID=182062 RepID=A0A8H5CKJ9_9AGAR|nr:hypothetical protein D9758_011853 [Tetrapyrgos nigripes]
MSASTSSTPAPTKFLFPDLVSHCNFPINHSRHRKQVTVETKRWIIKGDNLSARKQEKLHGLKAGTLAALCYPDAAYPQLRVCNDFLTYLFHLDDLIDDMEDRSATAQADVVNNVLYHPNQHPSTRVGKMTKDFWRRMISTASPGCQQRFISYFDYYFQSVAEQARDRSEGVIPDLESYIALRRDTSGCKSTFALIEFANNLDIPDEVMEHPSIRSLDEACNDLVTWSNDLFSYNKEQAIGDTHNMIPVIMNEQGCDLQTAVDMVGDLCRGSIDRFIEEWECIPSWGPEIDRQVHIYVQGLADWIVGSLHWSFESERYFGKQGLDVKKNRVVTLLPKKL